MAAEVSVPNVPKSTRRQRSIAPWPTSRPVCHAFIEGRRPGGTFAGLQLRACTPTMCRGFRYAGSFVQLRGPGLAHQHPEETSATLRETGILQNCRVSAFARRSILRYRALEAQGTPATIQRLGKETAPGGQAFRQGGYRCRTDVALATNLVLNLCNAFLCILLGCLLDYGIEARECGYVSRSRPSRALRTLLKACILGFGAQQVVSCRTGGQGVAAATVISNYVALAFGCHQIWRNLRRLPWLAEGSRHIQLDASAVFSPRKLAKLATLNVNILVRSACMMVIAPCLRCLSSRGEPALLTHTS